MKHKRLIIVARAVVITAGLAYFLLPPPPTVDVAQSQVPLPPDAIVQVALQQQLSE
jgi:hypothetical protein